MSGYWPTAPADNPFTAGINRLPKYVASTTLEEPLRWNNARLLQGDVPEAVARLKREPGGDLVILGSGRLVQSLLAHNLIDQYELLVFPIVLGGGKRLFAEGAPPAALTLVESRATATGVVLLTYRPAG